MKGCSPWECGVATNALPLSPLNEALLEQLLQQLQIPISEESLALLRQVVQLESSRVVAVVVVEIVVAAVMLRLQIPISEESLALLRQVGASMISGDDIGK